MNVSEESAPYARVFVKEMHNGQSLILLERGNEAYPFASCNSKGVYGAGPVSDVPRVRKEMNGVSPREIRDKENSLLVDAIISERDKSGIGSVGHVLADCLDRLLAYGES